MRMMKNENHSEQTVNRNISELKQVSISVPISDIHIARLNEFIYRKIHYTDSDVQELSVSIRENGLKAPLLLSEDYFIISGHRRYHALQLLGWHEIPCNIEYGVTIHSENFIKLLRECNRNRVKSVDEIIREAAIDAADNDDEAWDSIVADKRRRSYIDAEMMQIAGTKKRAVISKAKKPFLDAIQKVIQKARDFWPLSDRQIHYRLLNDPPLIHAKKPKSRYANNSNSYQALCNILTRARLTGLIPWNAIADPTRPVGTWEVYPSVEPFIKDQWDEFLKGYWRDYTVSQPHHIEIVGEKNTVQGIISPIAAEFCIPYTIGRGYASVQPRYELYQRYQKSAKHRLVLLILSDHDPDGEEIAHSFCRSMRDDFSIENIFPVRVALTKEQVDDLALPAGGKAKKTSRNYQKFVEKYGDDVFELEAIPPEELQEMLREAILSVIDGDALQKEKEQERADTMELNKHRKQLIEYMGDQREP